MLKHHNPKTIIAGFLLILSIGWGGNLAAQTNPIGFSISDASVTEKDTFVLTLSADSLLTAKSVFSYRFYISYSPTYLEFIRTDGTGPVLTDWGSPTINSSNQGTLILAGAGSQPLTGNGEMLYLKFRAIRSGNVNISFNTSESYLNEGNPASSYSSGNVYAAARSYPDIYPDQQQMYIGDEVQMYVSGGQEPYAYAVDDPSVAQITDGTRVRAVGPGSTKIRVTDGNGEVSVTTGIFDVRAVKMDLQEVSVWPEDTFYIPVKIEIAPGTTVYAGRFDLTFPGGLTALSKSILQGDFSAVMESNPKSDRVSVSFASSSGITGNGILCYLPFRANYSGNHWVNFAGMRFNENLLSLTVKSNYYIGVNSLPDLNISPNSGTMMWGETLKLNVYNGTAPYSYTISDPELASIDLQGNLTAITGGEVRVTAKDDNGAVKTSGIFTINDNQVSVYSSEGVLDTETRVPIITSSLPPGKLIYSYKADISFDDTYLEFAGTEPANSGGLIQASQNGNNVRIAAASGEGINSGIIGFLVFRIKSSLALNSTTNISFNSFTANENSLYSVRQNGSIRRVEQTSYRPVAMAGMDFSLNEGGTGQLDGTASFDLDGDPLTYLWRAPEGIILTDSTSATPEFHAPYVDKNTIFTFTLIVNDGTADSDPAEVNVTVLQVNHPPVADAGIDQSYAEGSSVNLDGSGSYDPDNDVLSYSWNALDGIVLFNATSANPSFILPQVTANTNYRFTLVVNDGALSSAKDTVIITSIQVNKKPVAFAGGDFSVNENEEYTLDGSLSYDADGDPITYKWTAPSQVTLSSTTVAKPSFTAPSVLRDSVLTFQLIVNDGTRDSDPDVVKANVINLDFLSSSTNIDSVYMTGLDSFAIDTTNANVVLYFPYGTNVSSLSPYFVLSGSASIYPAGGSSHDFSMPVYYSVTAEDGITSRMWKVEVFRPERTVVRSLNSGWNWLSLNVQPPQNNIVSLFSNLTLNDLDYIKSAEYSSIYYNSTGWFGSLSSFPQKRVVRFKKSLAENLVVQGLEINPAITSIPYTKGWNDIAYLLRSNAHINNAINTSSLPSGDVVLKGLAGSAVYYPGSGWVGDIDTLRVLHGYKLNVSSPGNLSYNPSGASKKSVAGKAYDHAGLLREYGIKPGDFEFSSTLIAEALTVDRKYFLDPDDLLLAYCDNEIRGVAKARYIPPLDRYIFILTYFSNEEEKDISFRLKRSYDNNSFEYNTNLSLQFRKDEITGGPYEPFELLINDLKLKQEDLMKEWISVYPNPVKDQITINSSAPLTEIRMYDMTGKLIMDRTGSEKEIILSVHQLLPGVYTLHLKTDQKIIIRKIIKTSY